VLAALWRRGDDSGEVAACRSCQKEILEPESSSSFILLARSLATEDPSKKEFITE
jgi:hypothetical protein